MVLTENGRNAPSKIEVNKEVSVIKEKNLSPIGKIIEIPSPTSEENASNYNSEEGMPGVANGNKENENRMEGEKEEVVVQIPPISQLVASDLWAEDPQVVRDSLRDLIKLTFQHEKEKENRNAVTWMGGHLAIIKVVEKFDDVDVTANGLRLLQILATLPDLRSVIAAIGGIEFVISRMKASDDLLIKTYGCGALQNFVADSDANKIRLVNAGGMFEICLAMKSYPHNDELQRFGCGAILNLASSSAQELKDRLVEQDGLVVLAMAMGNYRYKQQVRQQAIAAFKLLL